MLRKLLLVLQVGTACAAVGFFVAEGFDSAAGPLLLGSSLGCDLLLRFLDRRRDRAAATPRR